MIKWFVIVTALLLIAGYFINASVRAKLPPSQSLSSDHYRGGQFHNAKPKDPLGFRKSVELWWRFFTEKKVAPAPEQPLPIKSVTKQELNNLDDKSVHLVKLGHSTILLKIMGEYWLIDPVFGERASPFSFLGPKRFHQPPINITDLPAISRVLISHNHYDHLDKSSIKQLADKVGAFSVPLGVEADLMAWGVDPSRITSFDWWQEEQIRTTKIAFTPTQHFSGRGIGDANKTLWGSWVIDSEHGKVFFSGDSGYFPGFKEIGERYGPFDLTLIETGAYDKDWPDIHMKPEQSVQAHMDLQGKVMVPIHNGTFDLAFHTWFDPFERVSAAAQQQSVQLSTPTFGQFFTAKSTASEEKWWQRLMN
ncbi:MBL fold metallo-hydrolase [Marinomonas epiphytica]